MQKIEFEKTWHLLPPEFITAFQERSQRKVAITTRFFEVTATTVARVREIHDYLTDETIYKIAYKSGNDPTAMIEDERLCAWEDFYNRKSWGETRMTRYYTELVAGVEASMDIYENIFVTPEGKFTNILGENDIPFTKAEVEFGDRETKDDFGTNNLLDYFPELNQNQLSWGLIPAPGRSIIQLMEERNLIQTTPEGKSTYCFEPYI